MVLGNAVLTRVLYEIAFLDRKLRLGKNDYVGWCFKQSSA